MADLNTEFGTFYDRIALTSGKKAALRKSRDAIRTRIRSHFSGSLRVKVPKFLGQGSYAMGTTVNPLDGEFDIDDGVYLQHLDGRDNTKWPTPGTVHAWLVQATDGHTNEKPVDKQTCVRVQYAGQYHVDLPSYAEHNGEYMLSDKGSRGWHRSDPLGLTLWFRRTVKQNGEQLRRIVRYLKAWADFQSARRGKMPSGLILTALAVENFRGTERDDLCFANTARSMFAATGQVLRVHNPVDSEEELTARLSPEQKARFQEAILALAADAVAAVETDDREKAAKLWRRQFGDRFPSVEHRIEIQQQRKDANGLAAFYGARSPSKPWAHY
ncbi:MAG: nucleotidyltransferase [Thermodesulfobacteriota bacterium]